MNVEIGAGNKPREGFVQFDHRKEDYDLACDELPVGDNSVDEIYMSHVLEHIPMFVAKESLLRLKKKLKKGGKLRIVCPDLRAYAEAYLRGDYDFIDKSFPSCGGFQKYGIAAAFLHIIVSFGNDTYLMNRRKDKQLVGLAHCAAYDYESLSNLLKDCGFEKIIRSDYIEGVDPHPNQNKTAQNPQIFVEAFK